jgi:hypothetical protein
MCSSDGVPSRSLVLLRVVAVALSTGFGMGAAPDGVKAEPYSHSDLWSDSWVAVDGAGRTLPGFNVCGPPRKDRWVGIFYWTWHQPQSAGPNDNTRILAGATNGVVDWPQNEAPYHWGEPELGYYLNMFAPGNATRASF